MNDQRFEYDIRKRAQAGVKATLRGAVAVYIIYLGYHLVRDASGPWQAAAGVFFIAAALAFGVYALRRWRLDLEAARLPEGKEPCGDEDADEDEDEAEDEDLPEDEAEDEDTFEDEDLPEAEAGGTDPGTDRAPDTEEDSLA